MQFINNISSTLNKEQNNENNKMDESRKNSGDNIMNTSANTPKSEQLKIIKINIPPRKIECRSEEIKSQEVSSLLLNLWMDKSPKPEKPQNINELMNQLHEAKNCISSQSPMPPMVALLKKNSSIGENPFWQINSPKRTELQAYRANVALCGKHFEETGLMNYISENESQSEEEEFDGNIKEFSFNQLEGRSEDISDVQSNSHKKIHNPFVDCEDLGDLTVNEYEDPNLIEDLFCTKEIQNENVQTRPKEVNKNQIKIKKRK